MVAFSRSTYQDLIIFTLELPAAETQSLVVGSSLILKMLQYVEFVDFGIKSSYVNLFPPRHLLPFGNF